jgi:hypothetical protein
LAKGREPRPTKINGKKVPGERASLRMGVSFGVSPFFILPKFNTMKKSILFSLGLALFFIYVTIAMVQNYGAAYAMPFLIMGALSALLFSGVMDYYKK